MHRDSTVSGLIKPWSWLTPLGWHQAGAGARVHLDCYSASGFVQPRKLRHKHNNGVCKECCFPSSFPQNANNMLLNEWLSPLLWKFTNNSFWCQKCSLIHMFPSISGGKIEYFIIWINTWLLNKLQFPSCICTLVKYWEGNILHLYPAVQLV